jgi:hypothetical protein
MMNTQELEDVCSARHMHKYEIAELATKEFLDNIKTCTTDHPTWSKYYYNYRLLLSFCSSYYHREWLKKYKWTLIHSYTGYMGNTCEIWAFHIEDFCKALGKLPTEITIEDFK